MNQRMAIEFPVRSYPYRIFYADTDAGGVVYYAQYFRMFEQMRTLYLEDNGISLTELAQRNCFFVCRRAEIDYLSPASLGDQLRIETQITALSKTTMTFSFQVTCSDRRKEDNQPVLVVQSMSDWVAVKKKNGHVVPCRIPEDVLHSLKMSSRD